MASVKENLNLVLEEIQKFRRRSTFADEPVKLVAVTKNHGVDLMREIF